MKKVTTLLLMLGLYTIGLAQTDVYLNINHKLGANAFNFNTTATNNTGDQFEVTRLDYYISRITLTFDGGQDTVLEDTYILVKAGNPANEYLGAFNINTLESVQFGIGVDQARNHSDITTYPSEHALSFQAPSMHWGWTAGYRFVAYEGLTASGNQTWQLHALGDQNYGYANVSTAGTMDGGNLIIALDADYQKALKNIDVDANLNYHGELQEAPTLLSNFQNEVFSEGTSSVGISESKANGFSLAPNPAQGLSKVYLQNNPGRNAKIVVIDLTGKKVSELAINGRKEIPLNIKAAGIYLVSLVKDGKVAESHKLVIQ